MLPKVHTLLLDVKKNLKDLKKKMKKDMDTPCLGLWRSPNPKLYLFPFYKNINGCFVQFKV
jgi:hypothetical protein